jgi:chemotaxis protein MotB
MARMRQQVIGLFTVAALTVGLVGCVPQEKYNALKLDRDSLAEQLAKSQSDANGARAEADSYKSQLSQFMNGLNTKDGLVGNMSQQLATLQAQYDELSRKYGEAMNRPGGGSALPPALTNELSQFAQQNPDLVDFDAAKGIVKFKSDVTFAVGDATVTPKAKNVIDRFAAILNSAAASGYELMVAGHTDNQRVSNPRTISAGHKDNWYLSSHRAISVANELMSQRVSPQRIGVVGYADQRPIASNGSSQGQEKNRRVEVLILPTTVRSTGVAPTAATPNRSNNRNLNKDSTVGGSEMNRPVYNK